MTGFLSQRRELGEFKKRYKWMVLVVIGAFVLLLGRTAYLQLFRFEHYASIARENITQENVRPATRGLIRDTEGRVVAANRPSYTVYLTPQRLRPDRDLARIQALMGLTAEQLGALQDRLLAVPPERRSHRIKVFAEIGRDQLASLVTHAGELPAVDVVATPVRAYPYGSLGAHALGYLNEVNDRDLEELSASGYGPGDLVGRLGVERAWESYLRGRNGYERVVVDARGGLKASSSSRPEIRQPVPGRDLVLTLDFELMRSIERAFRGHASGAAVVVEARTGRVRALFSKPSYDLNEMTGRLTTDRYEELRSNPFRPLIDKTLYDTYFPGSTFKPISTLAGLRMDDFSETNRVECLGYHEVGNRRFRCTAVHGDVDLRSALVQSCNVYIWKLAEQLGIDRLNAVARDFGFGQRTGIGINSEAGGFIATREWYEQSGRRFMVGFTMNTAIGQGNTRVTLLQLAMAYAAIANGGALFVPQLVERVEDPSGEVIEAFEPQVRRTVDVPAEHFSSVVDGLYGVVNDPSGTAYDARVEGGVPVAGKTGTAQVQRRPSLDGVDDDRAWYFNRSHAWFAGFAPAGDPEIAIVVLVEHGGAGGRYAAPIATQIIEEYLGGGGYTTTAALTRGL